MTFSTIQEEARVQDTVGVFLLGAPLYAGSVLHKDGHCMKLLTALKTKLPLRGDNGTKTTIYVAFEIITGWNMEGCMTKRNFANGG
ncbi:uncharacterized protein H6S33_004881 [Morchella sextelata]|uniref:uncharacterized protein n=1 Tax=Morchella sextelata TaxID=1174677 RepID=UPI001D051225|nr:uncharacterized protein H6S33_004881 [Morchella sextelata]KAH0605659.1 hypothetical protein H6S33_004881 [Morchella sextelata]